MAGAANLDVGTTVSRTSRPVLSNMSSVSKVTYNYTTYSTQNNNFNATLAISVAALVSSFLIMGFIAGYCKRRLLGPEVDAETNIRRLSRRHRRQGSKTQRGLDPEIVEALPIVQYRDLLANNQLSKDFDCPVCLSEFDGDDKLRFLPNCNHVFHLDCIDLWFRSHSTCPLCRASLAHSAHSTSAIEAGESNAEDDVAGDGRISQDDSVVEVVISGNQERVSGSDTAASGLRQEQDVGAAVKDAIGREEEWINTRSMLGSNAAPFKRAVRIVVAPEKTALASIRRSNSVGSELKSLHDSYIVHSEGTQHNGNFKLYATDVDDASKGHDRSPAQQTAYLIETSRDHWMTIDLESGASNVGSSASRDVSSKSPATVGSHRVWPERWSFSTLRGIKFPLQRTTSDFLRVVPFS